MHLFEGEESLDLDLLFHQSTPPLSEENLVYLDLGFIWCSSSLFFLSYPSLVFVALVGFGSEGLDHFVWSCLSHLVDRFEFPTVIRGIEV